MRAFVIGALCAGLASGFAPRPARQTPASLAATASEVESYQKLMSDYLVKSHEQRIKAVAEARTQATLDADARIHQLEHELSSLLGGSAPSAPSAERGAIASGACRKTVKHGFSRENTQSRNFSSLVQPAKMGKIPKMAGRFFGRPDQLVEPREISRSYSKPQSR